MSARRSKPINLRRTGLAVAVGVGLISVGVTLFMFARRGQTSGAGASVGPITSGVKPQGDVARLGDNLSGVGKAVIQYVDRRDPTRVAGTIQWASLEPQPNNRATVAEPRASIFLKDGRTIVVAAPRGRLFTPPRSQQPESGFFEGGVLVALFSPGPGGAVDTTKDSPVLLFHAPSLSFDLALGELSSGDVFAVSARNLDVRGRGFRVLFNQVAERIERLDIEHIDLARVAPGVRGPDQPEATPGAGHAAASKPGPTPPDAVTTLYQVLAQGDVRLSQRGRSLKADTLNVWARLVDNGLPPGALPSGDATASLPAGEHAGPTPKLPAKPAPRAIMLTGMPEPGVAPPPSLCPITEDDVSITWTGPLQMIPLAAPPAELDKDFVFARFASPRSGEVVVEDTAMGFTGHAPQIDVGATRQEVTLSGTGPSEVALTLARKGTLSAGHVSLNVPGGVVSVKGAGSLTTADQKAAQKRTIQWTDQANFTFAKGQAGTTDRLEWANFAGAVSAVQSASRLDASSLIARFAPGRDPGTPVLSEVRATDATARSGEKQQLSAPELVVKFAPPVGDDVTPQTVQASGGIAARSGDAHLYGDALLVELDRDEQGQPAVRKAYADGNVSFERTGPTGLVVNSDHLTATMPEERIELVGPLTSITSGGATILGRQMVVDGVRKELFVHGPGVFTLRKKLEGGAFGATPVLSSSWDASMRINDLGGIAELFGSAQAVATPKPDEIDLVSADRLVIAYTPGQNDSTAAAPATTIGNRPDPVALTLGGASGDQLPERRLLKIEAIGASVEQGSGPRATVESRQYAADKDAAGVPVRSLRRHLYLEGDRILASAAEGTLQVPGRGRLLIDQREPDRPSGEPATPSRPQQDQFVDLSRGKTGTSLFDWTGSLLLNRVNNTLQINEGVRLIHRRTDADPVVTLQCQTISGVLRDAPGAPTSEANPDPVLRPAELRSALASGQVYVQSDDGKQMTADELTFDVDRQMLEASGGSEARVQFTDPKRPAPLSAQRLIWYLREGRVEAVQPSAVIVPR